MMSPAVQGRTGVSGDSGHMPLTHLHTAAVVSLHGRGQEAPVGWCGSWVGTCAAAYRAQRSPWGSLNTV